ncbi:hypothetical protein EVAR_63423_1 [Eumeta japonica]|uniref:RNA-directed DNA polymerase from mobile element jockey n=1 Tax=Eumeta variegata TaxID=151549 RepID=A0A4C1ZPD5_EUMVA|nr:hypothetical protein EVAR_63423_1 [Eumeta japonica]
MPSSSSVISIRNVRWGCPSNNYNGIKLDELEDRLDFGIIALYVDMFPMSSHRPSTIDIALTKGVALNFNSIETIHGLTSDHRPVILKWDLTAGGLFPSAKLLIGKECRPCLRKSTLQTSIAFPMTSRLQTRLTCHRCSYQPRQDSGRGERAGGSGILGSPEVSARYSRIDKSKNAALPRERISHSRVQIQSASSPTRSESSRSGIPK